MNNPLTALFNPRSVAVIGASTRPGSVGHLIISNLVHSSYPGHVFAVNAQHKSVLDLPSYKTVKDIEQDIDLAVICTPEGTVEKIIRQCGKKSIPTALILTNHPGPDLKRLNWRTRIAEAATRAGVRIIGPNAMGIYRTLHDLNLLYNRNQVSPGKIAFVSQAAGLCDALLDWSQAHGIGYSTVLTVGDSVDINIGEALNYLAREPQTRLLLVYIDDIEEPRNFLNGLRLAARLKPVLIFTGGAPDSPLLEAAIQRCGGVLLHNIDQLFTLAKLLIEKHLPGPEDLSIITNGIGPDYLAIRRLEQYELKLMELREAQRRQLEKLEPSVVRIEKSIVLAAISSAEIYEQATRIASHAQHSPVLLIITPRPETQFDTFLDSLLRLNEQCFLLISVMGESRVRQLRKVLRSQSLYVFDTPLEAIDVYAGLVRYKHVQRLVRELPPSFDTQLSPDLLTARSIIADWVGNRKLSPTKYLLYQLLRSAGMPLPDFREAGSLQAARNQAKELGYPVVIKPQVQNTSSNRGGITVYDEAGLRHQYLAMIGQQQRLDSWEKGTGVLIERREDSAPDTIKLGIVVRSSERWGRRIEVITPQQRTVCNFLPLSRTLTAEMTDRLGLNHHHALQNFLLQLSGLICECPEIDYLEIRPLWLDVTAVEIGDAQITLTEDSSTHPYGHLLLHPYPTLLETRAVLDDGDELHIRPLLPEDAEAADQFLDMVSDQSLYQRFLHPVPGLDDQMLTQLTQLNLHEEMALLAAIEPRHVPAGVARYARDGEDCNFAILIADPWQGKGIGRRLLSRLIEVAKDYGYRNMTGDVLSDNIGMLGLARSLGFEESHDTESGLIRIILPLRDIDRENTN
jgi:acetyltransferase